MSLFSALRLAGENPASLVVVGLLLFANSVAMFLAGVFLGARQHLAYLFALALVLVNILLIFTDQVGLLDWLTVLVDLILLALPPLAPGGGVHPEVLARDCG